MVVAFITRRMTVLPLVSRLNPEQAAAAFMLGESVETSAGDPRRAGESVRVVGTNPFLIGSEADEGNWFYDFVKNNEDKVQCYLLNTGGVGGDSGARRAGTRHGETAGGPRTHPGNVRDDSRHFAQLDGVG